MADREREHNTGSLSPVIVINADATTMRLNDAARDSESHTCSRGLVSPGIITSRRAEKLIEHEVAQLNRYACPLIFDRKLYKVVSRASSGDANVAARGGVFCGVINQRVNHFGYRARSQRVWRAGRVR